MRLKIYLFLALFIVFAAALFLPVAAEGGMEGLLGQLEVEIPEPTYDPIFTEMNIPAESGATVFTFYFPAGSSFFIDFYEYDGISTFLPAGLNVTMYQLFVKEADASNVVALHQFATRSFSDYVTYLSDDLCGSPSPACAFRLQLTLSEPSSTLDYFRVMYSTPLTPVQKYLLGASHTSDVYVAHSDEAAALYYNVGVSEGRQSVINTAVRKGTSAGQNAAKEEYQSVLSAGKAAYQQTKNEQAAAEALAKQEAIDETLHSAFAAGQASVKANDLLEGVIDGVFSGVQSWFRDFMQSTSITGMVLSGVLLVFLFVLLAFFILKLIRG